MILAAASMDPDPGMTGTITDDTRAGVWIWNAIPKAEGYYMTFRRPGGSIRGSWTGVTWNLGLEVAQGFKQVVGRLKG